MPGKFIFKKEASLAVLFVGCEARGDKGRNLMVFEEREVREFDER
jgi:hypothetical protein